ncbi:hypothetical protein [Winogradskyella sp. PE311]|uniref:hypothetical protein n=1 Tax=Winogradskyella sp. PE311 TaxID=3366943 RepID=UPI003980177F
MKKLFFILLFSGFSFLLGAQSNPKIGDEFTIKTPTAQNFHYIEFPKLNILVKRGKIANYKSVYNNVVVVDEIMTLKDGSTYVMLKKKDGSKFFGFLSKVKAKIDKALAAKELVKTK